MFHFLATLFLMLFFQMLHFYFEIFVYFLDNFLFHATLIKDRFPIWSPQEFLYQLVRLATNW